MNFKLKALVAALVLSASATSANAAIDANAGNSELFFSAWDSVAGVGYTYDLNWGMFLNDIVGADQVASPAGNTILANNASHVQTNGNNILFDDVLTGLPFGLVSNVEWNLGAYDTSGRFRLLMTQGDSGLPFASINGDIKAAATILSVYTPQANGKAAVAGNDTYSVTAVADGVAYAGNLGNNLAGRTVDTTNVLGGTSFMYLLANTSLQAATLAQPSFSQQLFADGNKAIVAKTYFQDGNWRLQVAAVPEPETNAMFLAGLGLMGFIARRRRNSLTK